MISCLWKTNESRYCHWFHGAVHEKKERKRHQPSPLCYTNWIRRCNQLSQKKLDTCSYYHHILWWDPIHITPIALVPLALLLFTSSAFCWLSCVPVFIANNPRKKKDKIWKNTEYQWKCNLVLFHSLSLNGDFLAKKVSGLQLEISLKGMNASQVMLTQILRMELVWL